MYGDCQILSSLPMMESPDSLFTTPPILNPSSLSGSGFVSGLSPYRGGFTNIFPKEEGSMAAGMGMVMRMTRGKRSKEEEEMESGSGFGSGYVEGGSGGEEQSAEPSDHHQPPAAKKKRYHRHTTHQIQELEAMFKECPHPDDKQRMRLSTELGLKPRQVKFWFQNRRTQMKAQHDRADNVMLRAENENLKAENYRLQAAVRSIACRTCGGPAVLGEVSYDELENARLKEELQRVSSMVTRYGSRPLHPMGLSPQSMLLPSLDLDMSIYSRNLTNTIMGNCGDLIQAHPVVHDHSSLSEILILDHQKPVALELAMTATEHLLRMCCTNEPLWVCGPDGGAEELNMEEYTRMFQWPVELGQWNGDIRSESTRDNCMVIMNSITLVNAFMDADKWMEMFPTIVSKAKTIQIISPGISSHGNGSLHLMYAEFQVISPLVPTRGAYFMRYCQQNASEGTWMVVDFPVDGFDGGQEAAIPRYRRRPSGCVIQDMPNGYSRVLWVEHVDVEAVPVHQIFDQFVSSGMAFGATRWLSVLERQCERLATLMAKNISDLGVIPSLEARKNMLKLSQRMIRTFCANISSSEAQSWTSLSDSSDDTIRIRTWKNTDPGQPNGVILSAASTTWLPFSHQQVFDLLTDERKRSQIDLLSCGNSMHEVAHIANGSHPRDCVSLLRVNAASNSAQNVELILQESSTHPTGGSLIVYATIDINSIQVAMSGEDPAYIPLLPAGFILRPAAQPSCHNSSSAPATGCLLTVGLQALTSALSSTKLNLSSVTAINNHLCNIVQQITAILGYGGTKTEQTAASSEH